MKITETLFKKEIEISVNEINDLTAYSERNNNFEVLNSILRFITRITS